MPLKRKSKAFNRTTTGRPTNDFTPTNTRVLRHARLPQTISTIAPNPEISQLHTDTTLAGGFDSRLILPRPVTPSHFLPPPHLCCAADSTRKLRGRCHLTRICIRSQTPAHPLGFSTAVEEKGREDFQNIRPPSSITWNLTAQTTPSPSAPPPCLLQHIWKTTPSPRSTR
jgi:hypothetical protein